MKRNNNSLYIFLIIVAFLVLSTGYAYLNTSLFINGTSIINANIWSVGLSNLDIIGGSVIAIAEPTIDNKATTTNFEVKLENKEDFYEFTVDVVNNGDHDARLTSLVETTGLTTEQANYFDYTVNYQNDGAIQVNQLVKKAELVRVKVRVNYKEDVDVSTVPDSAKTLSLGLKLNYDLNDGNGTTVENNGRKIVTPVANGSLEDIGTIVTIGSEQFYTIGTEGDNVKLLSMYNLYVGNEVTAYNTDDRTFTTKVLTNPTGMQSSNAKGYVSDEDGNSLYPWVGTTAFSNTSSEYSGSIVEGYVNNYKNKLENRFGVDVVEARIITKDELINKETFACAFHDFCSANYPWIYSTTYWIGEVYDELRNWSLCGYSTFAHIDYRDYTNDTGAGVRPVIVIPKSAIKVETVVNEIETVDDTGNGDSTESNDGTGNDNSTGEPETDVTDTEGTEGTEGSTES